MVRAATLPEPSRRAEQAGSDRRRTFISTVLDGCLYHPSTSSGNGFINTQRSFERGYSPDHFRQFSRTRYRIGNEEHVAWGQQSPERAFQPIHRRVLDGDTLAGSDTASMWQIFQPDLFRSRLPAGSLDRNVSGTCSRMSFHARISGAWPARANLSDQLAGELSQNSTILPSEQTACSPRRRASRVTSGRLGVAIQSSNTSSQRRNTAGSTRGRLDDFAHRQPNTLSGSRNSSRAAEAIRSGSLSSIQPLVAPDGAPSANRGVRSRGRS